jgi:hypothetical protein
MSRRRLHLDGLEDGAQIEFKLLGQLIDVLPLKRSLIESDVGRDMVGNEIQLIGLKNSKCLGLYLIEGCVGWNTLVGKKFEHLTDLAQVLVVLSAVFIHLVFGYVSGFIAVASDMINFSTGQIFPTK